MPNNKKRTNVKNLKTAKELTPAQAKRVKGGVATLSQIQQKVADGSVKIANITDGTSNTLLLPAVRKK